MLILGGVIFLLISFKLHEKIFFLQKTVKTDTSQADNLVKFTEKKDIFVRLLDTKTNVVRMIPLEAYVVRVLAAEVPIYFEWEALKAQSVAARTYVYGRMKGLYGDHHTKGADVCDDSSHCQAFIERVDYISGKNKEQHEENWKKYEDVVQSTKGIVLQYNEQVINPLFHSNSAGLTEDAKNIWTQTEVPYLQSVASIGDDLGLRYEDVKIFEVNTFLQKAGIKDRQISAKKMMQAVEMKRNETNRVLEVQIFEKKIEGMQFRKLFSLNSTLFEIHENAGKIEIKTHGFGHGVGMSQWGANYMAMNGSLYSEILKHYYRDTHISIIVEEK